MKRIITLLLMLTLIGSLLSACGNIMEDNEEIARGTIDTSIAGTDVRNDEESNTIHTHEYVAEIKVATCTKDGYTLHSCICGDSYSDNKVGASGHSFGAWKTTTEPTVLATGKAERICSKCNEVQTKTLGQIIENHKHSYTSQITVSPTCKEEGEKIYSCFCGEKYSVPINTVCHQYSRITTNPTCTTEGYTTYTCSVCGTFYRDDFAQPIEHDWYDESCITPTICLSCSAIADFQTGFDAGHDWIESTCTTPSICRACGYTAGVAEGHDYLRWDIGNYPTCTEEGYEVSWCTKCDNEEHRPVGPRGHKYVAGICSVCGDDNNVYSNVNGVTLNYTTLSLNIGEVKQLISTVSPSNAGNKKVIWSSSNSSVAQVSSTGKVTAEGKGSATITVTTVDGGYFATCTVAVKEPQLTVSISMGVGYYMSSSGSVRGVFAETIASGGSGNYVEYYIKVYYNGDLVAEGAQDEMVVTLANGTYTSEVYVKDSSGNEATASKTVSYQGY